MHGSTKKIFAEQLIVAMRLKRCVYILCSHIFSNSWYVMKYNYQLWGVSTQRGGLSTQWWGVSTKWWGVSTKWWGVSTQWGGVSTKWWGVRIFSLHFLGNMYTLYTPYATSTWTSIYVDTIRTRVEPGKGFFQAPPTNYTIPLHN
jgi:hypothetical protein